MLDGSTYGDRENSSNVLYLRRHRSLVVEFGGKGGDYVTKNDASIISIYDLSRA